MNNGLTKILSCTLLLAIFSGCQSMTTGTQAPFDNATTEAVVVQIRPSGSKAYNKQVALKPNMRLQDVLNATPVKFRSKLAYIVRTSPSSGERHKLEANFGANRKVSLETDYAIQPGDRVVIEQDTTSSFDRVMQTMLGRS